MITHSDDAFAPVAFLKVITVAREHKANTHDILAAARAEAIRRLIYRPGGLLDVPCWSAEGLEPLSNASEHGDPSSVALLAETESGQEHSPHQPPRCARKWQYAYGCVVRTETRPC